MIHLVKKKKNQYPAEVRRHSQPCRVAAPHGRPRSARALPCSILGMHLFGCKFASERDGDTLPDRKNFDSLLWAIVTVFQVQTRKHPARVGFGAAGAGDAFQSIQ